MVRAAVFLSLITLTVLTIPFLVTDLDLVLQRLLYDPVEKEWRFKESPFWEFFYLFGPAPAILFGTVSLLVLLLGLGNPRLAKYRKLGAYFVGVLLLGSGLITNAILKDHWGRPRPKQVIEFNGTESFDKVLVFNPNSTGESFPSGHATVGYFFLAFVPLVAGRWRWFWFVFSILFGTLIGLARVAQGAHFSSDVIWSAAVMWFVSLALFQWLKLAHSPWWQPLPGVKSPPRWIPWVSSPLIIAAILLTATYLPYEQEIETTLSPPLSVSELTLAFNGHGVVEFQPGKDFTITCFAEGHRAPKSRLFAKSLFTENPPSITVNFRQRGFFSELNVRTVITVPKDLSLSFIGQEKLHCVMLPSTMQEPALKIHSSTRILRR